MKTPPHLLPPPSNLAPLHGLVPPSWDLDDDTLNNDYVSYDELLRDVRNYTGVLDFTADIPPRYKNASGTWFSRPNPTSQFFFTPAAPFLGAASPVERLPRAAGGPSSREVSPPSEVGASPEPGGLSPAPGPAIGRRGNAIRNRRIPRSIGITWRAPAAVPSAVTDDPRPTTQLWRDVSRRVRYKAAQH